MESSNKEVYPVGTMPCTPVVPVESRGVAEGNVVIAEPEVFNDAE